MCSNREMFDGILNIFVYFVYYPIKTFSNMWLDAFHNLF